MEQEKIVVGLDIGTTKICVIVGRKNEFGKLEVLGMGKAESEGVVKGIVFNIDKTVYAIEKANLVYAQRVLAMNFDPNLHHDNGYTPLAYAALKGSVPMLELLLRNGADPAMLTREGDTPVELALRMGHAEAADLLKRARRKGYITLAEQEPLVATAEELGKMLGGFIKYLNNCDWKDRGRHGE